MNRQIKLFLEAICLYHFYKNYTLVSKNMSIRKNKNNKFISYRILLHNSTVLCSFVLNLTTTFYGLCQAVQIITQNLSDMLYGN